MKITNSKLAKNLPYLLIVVGLIGFICAFAIMFDDIRLLKNPHYIPSCNLNPIISCGSVMQSLQAHIFGFSNPFIGLAAFPVLATVGVAQLAGATFKRWFWLGLEAATILGVVFVHWLAFQSVYRIHALCPWCMGVWAVTITAFWYVTLYNLETGAISLKRAKLTAAAHFARRHHLDILIIWFLVIAGLILKHFWYYYGHYL